MPVQIASWQQIWVSDRDNRNRNRSTAPDRWRLEWFAIPAVGRERPARWARGAVRSSWAFHSAPVRPAFPESPLRSPRLRRLHRKVDAGKHAGFVRRPQPGSIDRRCADPSVGSQTQLEGYERDRHRHAEKPHSVNAVRPHSSSRTLTTKPMKLGIDWQSGSVLRGCGDGTGTIRPPLVRTVDLEESLQSRKEIHMIELGWPTSLLSDDDRARFDRYEEATSFFRRRSMAESPQTRRNPDHPELRPRFAAQSCFLCLSR